jgi:hypothetical protein
MIGRLLGMSILAVFTSITEAEPEPQPSPASSSACVYGLDTVPADAAQIQVFFNHAQTSVPSNPRNGWTYSATTNAVTFHGSTCDAIESGRVHDIDIVADCGDQTRSRQS